MLIFFVLCMVSFFVGIFQLANYFVGITIMCSLKIKYLYDEIYLIQLFVVYVHR